VTVTAVNDVLVEASPHSGSITHTATSSDTRYNGISIVGVTAQITDNDLAGFTVTQSGGTTIVAESGTTDTFTVVLTAQPASNVVFNISSNDLTEATVSPATLTFTSANWNVAKTVTVTGVDDVIVDGSQTSIVTISVNDPTSNDFFDPLADKTVSVTTTDNDTTIPIQIFAAGVTGEEQMQLLVSSVVVATWNNIAGNPNLRNFLTYNYTHPTVTTLDQVRVAFSNEGNTAGGLDRNLVVDAIMFNGQRYETEAAATYSTGSYDSVTGCAPGNKQIETLHCFGPGGAAAYFQYAGGPSSFLAAPAAPSKSSIAASPPSSIPPVALFALQAKLADLAMIELYSKNELAKFERVVEAARTNNEQAIRLLSNARIAENTDRLDLDLDDVAMLEKSLRFSRDSNARGRAGKNNVTDI
jgi:hypothetical protein